MLLAEFEECHCKTILAPPVCSKYSISKYLTEFIGIESGRAIIPPWPFKTQSL